MISPSCNRNIEKHERECEEKLTLRTDSIFGSFSGDEKMGVGEGKREASNSQETRLLCWGFGEFSVHLYSI